MEGTQSSITNIVFFVFLILTESFVPFQSDRIFLNYTQNGIT